MALTNCRECSTEVSDTAFKCPKCGVQLRKLKRGFFGKLIKWSFILFNISMITALFVYFAGIGHVASTSVSDAEKIGTAIGGTLGISMISSIWFFGDIILGLFVLLTRPKAQ